MEKMGFQLVSKEWLGLELSEVYMTVDKNAQCIFRSTARGSGDWEKNLGRNSR